MDVNSSGTQRSGPRGQFRPVPNSVPYASAGLLANLFRSMKPSRRLPLPEPSSRERTVAEILALAGREPPPAAGQP
jgi:hypothetical protein